MSRLPSDKPPPAPGVQSWLHTHPGTMAVFLLAGLTVVGAGIKFAAPVLIPVLLALLLAIVSLPLVQWLRRHRVPRIVAVTLAVAADVTLLLGMGWLVTNSLGRLTARLPAYGRLVEEAVLSVGRWLQRISPRLHLPDILDEGALASSVGMVLGEFAGFLTSLTLAMILAAFLLFEMARPKAEPRGLPGAPEPVRRAIREVNKYVAIKTVVSMTTGLLVAGWLYVCGDDLPVLFGLLAFVLNFIPNLGSILAAIPACLLVLLQHGFAQAAVTAAGYLLINIVIGNVVEPRVMGRALGLSPTVVILSVVFWGWLLGPVGALMSALLTVLVKLGLSSTEDLRPFAVVLGPATAPRPRPKTRDEEEEELVELVVPQSKSEPTTESPPN